MLDGTYNPMKKETKRNRWIENSRPTYRLLSHLKEEHVDRPAGPPTEASETFADLFDRTLKPLAEERGDLNNLFFAPLSELPVLRMFKR